MVVPPIPINYSYGTSKKYAYASKIKIKIKNQTKMLRKLRASGIPGVSLGAWVPTPPKFSKFAKKNAGGAPKKNRGGSPYIYIGF